MQCTGSPLLRRAGDQVAVCRAPVFIAAASGILGALWCQVKLQETLPVQRFLNETEKAEKIKGT